MSRIVLATADEGLEAQVREAFGESLNGHLRRWMRDLEEGEPADLVGDLVNDAPDVVAFGADVSVDTALRLARVLDRDRPEITVMLVTKPNQKIWEQAMKAGVEVVISPEAGGDELREEFERALESADRRRENLTSDGGRGRGTHRVITVVAAKGGAGKSVVATNLAAGLAMAEPGQVAIVDLDLQFGDVAGGLQLAPEHTIADAARSRDLDLTNLKVFLTPHPLDLYALCGPDSPAEADDVVPEAATRIVQQLSEEFRYVVVDTPGGLSDHTLNVFDVTTDLVIVGNMDVASVRATRKEVDVLDDLGLVRPVRHFVLNRADSRVGLDRRDVEATVGLRVDVSVPSSRSVPIAFNQGSPLVHSDPRSPVAKAFMDLVGHFAEVPSAPSNGTRRSWRRNGS